MMEYPILFVKENGPVLGELVSQSMNGGGRPGPGGSSLHRRGLKLPVPDAIPELC